MIWRRLTRWLHQPRTVPLISAILIVAAIARFSALDDFALIDPSEGRYASIAKEMAESGDYVVPRFENGEPFWGKPPMYFWSAALAISAFGNTAFAARLPSFIFSCLTALITFILADKLYGRQTARGSIIILSCSLLFYSLAGIVLVDTSLVFFCALALYGFIFSQQAAGRRQYSFGLLLYIFALAAAILSKGFIALLITFPPVLAWTLFQKHSLRRITFEIAFIAAAIALSIPWHILADSRSPGFLDYYIIGEHFLRFTQPGWESLYGTGHIEPRGIIWGYIVLGLLPWSIVIPYLFWRENKNLLEASIKPSVNDIFFLAWALPLPLLFTFSSGVMYTYALPSMPALAILLSRLIARTSFFEELQLATSRRWAAVMFLIPAGYFLVSQTILPIVGMNRSQAILLEAIQSLDSNNNAEVIYVGKKPYSADFYQRVSLTTETHLHKHELRKHLADGNQDYFVSQNSETALFDDFVKRGRLERVLATSKRTIFREPDSADIPIAKIAGILPWSFLLLLTHPETPNNK